MPYRDAWVQLAPAPCQSRASKAKAVPAGPIAATVGTGCGTAGSGCRPERWLPGTSRVAPFSSVKSVIIHMTLAQAIGAIGPVAGEGARDVPAPRRAAAGRPGGSPGSWGVGIHHWSI